MLDKDCPQWNSDFDGLFLFLNPISFHLSLLFHYHSCGFERDPAFKFSMANRIGEIMNISLGRLQLQNMTGAGEQVRSSPNVSISNQPARR